MLYTCVHWLINSPKGHAMPPEGAQALADIQTAISKHCPDVQLAPVDRFEFYEQARRSFAVVRSRARYHASSPASSSLFKLISLQIHTLERRPYANVLLTKGVVGADGRDMKPLRM
jgi:L-fucose mutarotase/ribose pyranase (RbsD/FucU family)